MWRTSIGGRSVLLCAAIVLALGVHCFAQSPPDPSFQRLPVFSSFKAFQDELKAIVATVDASARTTRLDALWSKLQSAGQVPFAHGHQYAMLYCGEASSVSFAGDHTNWQPSATATRPPGTDLWVREGTIPADARIDYKIVVNGRDWRLDPANPLLMWSGFGPNSELRMPKHKFPRETIRRPGVAHGQLGDDTRIASTNLGYDVQYRVYTPAGYEEQRLAHLPVVYVADGHEYAADHVGSLTAVLDNLIDSGKLRPMIAVFIDPRDPNNPANNRRIAEYNMNPKFAAFVAAELVPTIDRAYRRRSSDPRHVDGRPQRRLPRGNPQRRVSPHRHPIAGVQGQSKHLQALRPTAHRPAQDFHDRRHHQRRRRRDGHECDPRQTRLRFHLHPGERRAFLGKLAGPTGRSGNKPHRSGRASPR